MSLPTSKPSLSEVRPSFRELVRARKSFRGFLPRSVDDATIAEVLEDAQWSASNCNTQPWCTHLVSGAKRDALSAALIEASRASAYSLDFPFSVDAYEGCYAERRIAQGRDYHEALAVGRTDLEQRRAVMEGNFVFFGAPHVALLFLPPVGDNSLRVAADIGMYAQTLMLSLTAHGLGSVAQTSLGMFADTIRGSLGISDEFKLLFGISFGYPDAAARGNRIRTERAPLAEAVTFHND
jgi:nitroreductase